MKIYFVKLCFLLFCSMPALASMKSIKDCDDFRKLIKNKELMSAMSKWAVNDILGKPIRGRKLYRFVNGYRFLDGAPRFFSEIPILLDSSIFVVKMKGRNVETFLLGTRFGVGLLFSNKNIILALKGEDGAFSINENKVVNRNMAYQCRIW